MPRPGTEKHCTDLLHCITPLECICFTWPGCSARDHWLAAKVLWPELLSASQMEVGIEDCLHIEFEYNKSRYHLRDTVVGKIYFLLVRDRVLMSRLH